MEPKITAPLNLWNSHNIGKESEDSAGCGCQIHAVNSSMFNEIWDVVALWHNNIIAYVALQTSSISVSKTKPHFWPHGSFGHYSILLMFSRLKHIIYGEDLLVSLASLSNIATNKAPLCTHSQEHKIGGLLVVKTQYSQCGNISHKCGFSPQSCYSVHDKTISKDI